MATKVFSAICFLKVIRRLSPAVVSNPTSRPKINMVGHAFESIVAALAHQQAQGPAQTHPRSLTQQSSGHWFNAF
jgi:hypothetical protein